MFSDFLTSCCNWPIISGLSVSGFTSTILYNGSMSKIPGRFLVSMGAMIEHPTESKILLLKRTPKADYSPGIWEEITGRLDQFEEPFEGLQREIKEEAGLEVDIYTPLNIFHIFRGEKTAENELIGIIYHCKAKSANVVISGEHTEYGWFTPEEALELTDHPGVKEDIQAYMQEKKKLEALNP
jgi:8-oxo-dGTP pyrophosphatase MutT (NUDIX family)